MVVRKGGDRNLGAIGKGKESYYLLPGFTIYKWISFLSVLFGGLGKEKEDTSREPSKEAGKEMVDRQHVRMRKIMKEISCRSIPSYGHLSKNNS